MDTLRLLEQAVTAHQRGELDTAAQQYEGVLQVEPHNPDALHLLGLIAHQKGQYTRAVELMERALTQQPAFPQARCNLGHALLALGRHRQATASYRRAIELGPDVAEAHLGLGMALAGQERFAEALEALRRAIALQPANAAAHNQAGNALNGLGRRREAHEAYRKATQLKPDFAEAQVNLGVSAQALGDPDTAREAFQTAIALRPDYAEAHNNLGTALQARGDYAGAIEAHRRAVAIKPDYADAHYNLGHAWRRSGRPAQALAAYRRAARLRPDTIEYWEGLAASIAESPDLRPDEALRADIERCLALTEFDPGQLARAVSAIIRQDSRLAALLESPPSPPGPALTDCIAILSDPVVRRFLARTHNTDYGLERLLVALRRGLLSTAAAGELDAAIQGDGFDFLCALSRQCFLNEYVFEESNEEGALVARLSGEIADRETEARRERALIALLGCYRPLHQLLREWSSSRIERLKAFPGLAEIIRQQFTEPGLEASIRGQLRRESEAADETSRRVRAQYEENPYPRWQHVTRQKARPIAEVLGAMFPGVAPGSLRWQEPIQILDAGCGTGKHTIELAMRFRETRVLGLDLSLSSLAYAERKRRELGIDNVEFAQADILQLSAERKFHLIVGTGVLHHLNDPVAGWRGLARALKRGGLMKIALYSALARRSVEAARARIRDWEIEPTPAGIRACRARIAALPPDDPARAILGSADFYTMSRCRDLIFHVQESRFTLPEIAKIIEALELSFLGFEFSDGTTLHRYRSRFPQDPNGTSLDCWHEYEMAYPNTFSGMYQLWLSRPTLD